LGVRLHTDKNSHRISNMKEFFTIFANLNAPVSWNRHICRSLFCNISSLFMIDLRHVKRDFEAKSLRIHRRFPHPPRWSKQRLHTPRAWIFL
jgi:hypothetical protein